MPGFFSVSDLAGFVNVFVSEAKVGNGSKILIWKFGLVPADPRKLPPVLRIVIFIGKAAIGVSLVPLGIPTHKHDKLAISHRTIGGHILR